MEGLLAIIYSGQTSFSVIAVLLLSYFHTAFAGIGLAAYTFLGYPFWFGYLGKDYGSEGQSRVEPHAVTSVPYILLLLFLAGTAAAELVDWPLVISHFGNSYR